MAVKYTLKPLHMIVAPNHLGEQEVVRMVVWDYVAEDGPYTARIHQVATPLSEPAGEFTPFSLLSEEQVAAWVVNAWTPEQKAGYQERLLREIEEKKTSSYTTLTPPWAK